MLGAPPCPFSSNIIDTLSISRNKIWGLGKRLTRIVKHPTPDGMRQNSIAHFALDGEGFACRRDEGRRFCCYRCFSDGKDLEDPAPKPLPPEPAAPEPAYAEVNPTRALPARRLALPAHQPNEEPPGPGGER